MVSISQQQLDNHTDAIAQNVFQIHTKWPHFRLLLNDIASIAEGMSDEQHVVSFERGLLYGGISLIAPYFHRQNFLALDCSPDSADNRGAYNASMVGDEAIIKIQSSRRVSIEDTGLESNSADLVLVPNLVHHVSDQTALFEELYRVVKPGGRVYIFESILRELHQIPDDYLRYTPFGMKNILESVGFEANEPKLDGGPFSAVAYCWVQALQYLPEDKRESIQKWFDEEEFPRLMQWDEQYTENRVRKHTSFPVGYSIVSNKPN